jgi:hypothetical protein
MMRGGTFELLLNFDAHGSNFLSDARKSCKHIERSGARGEQGDRG